MPAARAQRYVDLAPGRLDDNTGDGTDTLHAQVRSLPQAQACSLVENALQGHIARILHMSPDNVELDRSVIDMGMDSLMGIELGMAVQETFGVKLSVMAITEGATISGLAQTIMHAIRGNAGALHDDESHGVADQVTAMFNRHAMQQPDEVAATVAATLGQNVAAQRRINVA
jgi:acyl carrier protein